MQIEFFGSYPFPTVRYSGRSYWERIKRAIERSCFCELIYSCRRSAVTRIASLSFFRLFSRGKRRSPRK